jgi:hypothetical protein
LFLHKATKDLATLHHFWYHGNQILSRQFNLILIYAQVLVIQDVTSMDLTPLMHFQFLTPVKREYHSLV